MQAEDHWAKAARIEVSRKKLNAKDDYELIIWSCIHAGAHLVNAALHKTGITPPTKDYIHSDKLESDVQVPDKVTEMLEILHSIELLGPRFVRGPEPLDQGAVDFCLTAYEKLKIAVKPMLA